MVSLMLIQIMKSKEVRMGSIFHGRTFSGLKELKKVAFLIVFFLWGVCMDSNLGKFFDGQSLIKRGIGRLALYVQL